MKKKKNTLIRGEVFEWIVPYVVILIIPILTCSAVFWHSFMITWDETKDLNEAALQLVRDDLDKMFEKSYAMEYSISNNYTVSRVQYLNKNMHIADNYKLMAARNALEQYKVWDESIYSCTIFFPELELWMWEDGYLSIANLYDQYALNYGMTESVFKELIFGMHKERVFFENVSNGNICYIVSYPISGKLVGWNIIIEFDIDYIQNVFSAMNSMEDNAIMIANKNGNILAENNDGNIDIKSINISGEDMVEYDPILLNGKKMLICCLQSRMVVLTYISIIPYEIFWHRAIKSLIFFAIALLTCSILGLSVSWVFARLRQRTYGILNYFIKEHFVIQEASAITKRKKIALAITNLIEEYKYMQNRLDSVNETKKELIISSIVEGKVRSENVEYVLRENSIEVDIANYVLVLIRNSKYGNVFENYEKQVTTADMEKMAEAVSCVVSCAEKNGRSCEVFHVSDGIVCIYNFGDKPVENENYCDHGKYLADCKEQLESLREHVLVAISAMHNQAFSLNYAYAEAMSVMEYLMTNPLIDRAMMEYSEMVSDRKMQYLFTMEDEVEFVGFLKNGKEEEAKQKVLDLCEKNILNSKGNRDLLKCMIMNLASCILQAENAIKNKHELTDSYFWLNSICKDISTNESIELLNSRIHDICALMLNQKDSKEEELIEKIKVYIKENYHDESLDNTAVAGYFGISLGYLSTAFKRNTGEKLVDYIQQIRIEEAKELLLISQLGIEEISSAVGCTSKTLRRLFKKYVGISPTQFREDNKKI